MKKVFLMAAVATLFAACGPSADNTTTTTPPADTGASSTAPADTNNAATNATKAP